MRPLIIDRLDAAAAALVQQVRPDLGFHHDEEPRPHQVERPAHDEGPVEREIEHAVHEVAQARARDLLPGHRRRRQKKLQPGIAGLQIGGQRAGGQRFADGDGVNPNRRLCVDVE